MRFFGTRLGTPGWLAIVVEESGVTLSHILRANGGRPAVTRCEFHSLSPKDARGIERLRKEASLQAYRCTTLLRPGEYRMVQVESPNVPRQELKNAVRWRVKDLIDFDVADATVDVLEIPPEGGGQPAAVYAVAAKNSVLRDRIAVFDAAKIPLAAIDVPEMAQRNVAALLEEEGRALAMLSFDARGGLLTITAGGELFIARHIDVTAGQLADADETLRQQNMERAALELQRSLDHFDRNHRAHTLNKLILAPLPDSAGLRSYLAANLYVPVETLDLGTVLDFSKTPELKDPAKQQDYFKALGAALRQEAAA